MTVAGLSNQEIAVIVLTSLSAPLSGFLYVFARGSPTVGVVALGTLGLGTFPTLFLYGTMIQSIDSPHRGRLHRALGVAFLVMGWMPTGHSLKLLGIPVPYVEVPIYQPL